MTETPIERMISADVSNPEMYMVSCALCTFKAFTHVKSLMRKLWREHKDQTGHDVGFIRGKAGASRRRANDATQ
jgi:hypothetical protein